ncbi:MAG: aminoacyl-tRNA synthetase [Candidatus Azambacteria bacterium]|nr:aminoacyl-tRNA synthetase [Candidatus Azambacteria bacterium]
MHISDQDYFRSCVAKERQLARLLGHDHIEECYESAGTLWDNAQALPKWTRDWNACGPLMTQYDIAIDYGKEPGQEGSNFATIGSTVVHFSDHPTKDRAIMYGIVKELIFRLEHHKAVPLK